MLYNAWPEVLRTLRADRGLTQEAAALEADVTPTSWYRWESGDIRPKRTCFDDIARGLGCTPDELGAAYTRVLADHYLPTPGGGEMAPREEPTPHPAPDADLAAIRDEQLDAASRELTEIVQNVAKLGRELCDNGGGPDRLERFLKVLQHTRSVTARTHTLIGVLEEISRESSGGEDRRPEAPTRPRKGIR